MEPCRCYCHCYCREAPFDGRAVCDRLQPGPGVLEDWRALSRGGAPDWQQDSTKILLFNALSGADFSIKLKITHIWPKSAIIHTIRVMEAIRSSAVPRVLWQHLDWIPYLTDILIKVPPPWTFPQTTLPQYPKLTLIQLGNGFTDALGWFSVIKWPRS